MIILQTVLKLRNGFTLLLAHSLDSRFLDDIYARLTTLLARYDFAESLVMLSDTELALEVSQD